MGLGGFSGLSMRCPACSFENASGIKFCGECGAALKLKCVRCGFENAPGINFCGECGQRLADSPSPAPLPKPRTYTPKHLAERILAEQAAMEARGAREGERKTITALFADIKGSVELMEDLDPEQARGIVDPALQVMMDAVHRYEGYVAQSRGDGILALFGAPIAHEDHPQRAIHAALRMQDEIKRHAEMLRHEKGVNLEIRVGLNTGEVVVRSIRTDDLHTDYVPVGHSINLAARLESLATPGSILVSEATHKLTDGYFAFKSLGTAKVKGVSEPLPIFQVEGVGPLRTKLEVSARRGLVKFVGRQTEMEQLRKALALAKSGHGQIVGVVGEPGVGKSRLCHEFKIAAHSGCLVLESFAVSHGKAYPYLPLVELLRNYFEIGFGDDERQRQEKIGGKALMLDRGLEDALPYLFSLLGATEADPLLQQMDPKVRRQRTFDAVKRLLFCETRNQPLLVVVEDLHWIDGETHGFLGSLGDGLATARLMLLTNYRPEYEHPWGRKTYFSELRLDPLEKESAEEILAALLGDAAVLAPLKRLILEKSEGTPFFIEEIVQTLFERGALVRNGDVRLTKSLAEIHIPPTVEGVLAARIDRRPAEEKDLLQIASVVGREFALRILARVTGKPEERLQGILAGLQAAEFVYQQPAAADVEYIFKHALTQEVAYNSMLIENRKLLHSRAGVAIETLFGDRLDDHLGQLAHHYSRSGDSQKALDYLQRAGHQAAQRSAYAGAIEHFTTALELLKALPDTRERDQQELVLQTAVAPLLMAINGYGAPEPEYAYDRAVELCNRVGDSTALFNVEFGLAFIYAIRGQVRNAQERAQQLLDLAQTRDDPARLLLAHCLMGQMSFWMGELETARAHLEQAIVLDDSQEYRNPAFQYAGSMASCWTYAAWTLWYMGYPDQGLQRIRRAVAVAREQAQSEILAGALNHAARFHLLRREPQIVRELAEEASALAIEHGFANWVAESTMIRGWALAHSGQEAEGIEQLQNGLAAAQAIGDTAWYLGGWPAEAYRKAGRTGEGLSLLAEALKPAHEAYVFEAELHRLKGELLLMQDSSSDGEAEHSFRTAIEVAQRQGARSLELSATTSLARLLAKQSKREEARAMLAEIYGWFTEGFDTADLKDAKALLDALS
jgi:class 3 adenylate cyclase